MQDRGDGKDFMLHPGEAQPPDTFSRLNAGAGPAGSSWIGDVAYIRVGQMSGQGTAFGTSPG